MKLKPNDHIILFIEKNDEVVKFFNDFGKLICKEILCDYIFFVDKLEHWDLFEIFPNNMVVKSFMMPTSFVTFNRVKYENGMEIKTIPYIKADGMSAL